ncbi:MAG: lytic transglycosylase domain-containing protein [Proteobacteria bacterium]|nr:lytic transglycosylase domain-containing protein [Pseudomonadota bacterium]
MRTSRRAALGAVLASLLVGGTAAGDIYAARQPDGTVSYTDSPTAPDYSVLVREAPPVLPWRDVAQHEAERYGLDPRLVRAVIYVESGEDPRAVSPKGAQGLMQLMPGTAEELGVGNAFRPRENIQGGVGYLATLLQRFAGSLELALAAYNAGPGAVQKYGGIPPYPETRAYVKKVLDVYRRQGGEVGVDTPGPPGHNPVPTAGRE